MAHPIALVRAMKRQRASVPAGHERLKMTTQISKVTRHLRSAWLLPPAADLTDGQLLERLVIGRATAALDAPVRRHGQRGCQASF
jgi:hypothetical protein